jgi:HEAT repeat protein
MGSQTEVELLEMLESSDLEVRGKAAGHPHASEAVLRKALEDEDSYVRQEAARNPHVTENILWKALDDEDQLVRRAAGGSLESERHGGYVAASHRG